VLLGAALIVGSVHETVGQGVVAGRIWTRTAWMERWSDVAGWLPSRPREATGDVTEWRVGPTDPPDCAPLAGCERVGARTEALWLVLDDGRRCLADEALWEAVDAGQAVAVHATATRTWCEAL
jgi:hypothetical protein